MTTRPVKWKSPWLNPVFEPYDPVVRVANSLVFFFINGNQSSVQIEVKKLGTLAPAVVAQAMLTLTETHPTLTEAFMRCLLSGMFLSTPTTKSALAFHRLHEMDFKDD